MDLNADGFKDIISGTYSSYDDDSGAGYFQVLYGEKDGGFSKATRLDGPDGMPLSNLPNLNVNDTYDLDLFYENVGTCPRVADLNGDGKLDLVSGNRAGTFFLFEGLGDGQFSSQPSKLMVGDKPLAVSGHSDPMFIDWDNDGDVDMLSGSQSGGVMLSLNQGSAESAHFAQFETLIKPYSYAQVAGQFGTDHIQSPCGSTRVAVGDLNQDGKLDLVVGDTLTLTFAASGLSDDQARERLKQWQTDWDAILEEIRPQSAAVMEKLEALGDALDEETEAKREPLYAELDKIQEKRSKVRRRRSEIVRSEAVGSVWVYYQK